MINRIYFIVADAWNNILIVSITLCKPRQISALPRKTSSVLWLPPCPLCVRSPSWKLTLFIAWTAVNNCWWSQNIYSILTNNFFMTPRRLYKLKRQKVYLPKGEKKVRRSCEFSKCLQIFDHVFVVSMQITRRQLIMIKRLQVSDIVDII